MIDAFYTQNASEKELSEELKGRIRETARSQEEFNGLVAELSRKNEEFKANSNTCKENALLWQNTKAVWDSRGEDFRTLVMTMMKGLGLSNATDPEKLCRITCSDNRSKLVVDSDKIIEGYRPLIESIRSQLPPYIEISLKFKQKEFGEHVKTDSTILVENPEIAHYEPTSTITFKSPKA